MMKEELEKYLHDFVELIYKQGFEDGVNQVKRSKKRYTILDIKKARDEGLKDAWEVAKKIVLSTDKGGIDAEDLIKIFDVRSAFGILESVNINDAMQKINEYEEQQKQKCESCFTEKLTKEKWASAKDCKKCKHFTDEVHGYTPCGSCNADLHNFEPKQNDATDIDDRSIKVGDEIYSDETDMTAIVHHIDAWGRYQCFNENGSQFILDKKTYDEYWHKTYKYYPQIAEVLEQLRNEE